MSQTHILEPMKYNVHIDQWDVERIKWGAKQLDPVCVEENCTLWDLGNSGSGRPGLAGVS